ncbi:iron ABC transporter permease [Bradyrhizobium jicamae]|uniref:ABC transporter permease n=1 Tax=Bradyrhizobium jicamae TaxID=280332 RepID=UPI001BA952C7|nr:iron ABC transporter permease [Bradyrhizobium jicamae]MBR0758243.1 iron ABC transporter permease [Bradyrhizobium jicamae]
MHGQADRRSDVSRGAGEGTRRRLLTGLWVGALLAILTFLVIYPVFMLLLGALTNTNPVVDGVSLSGLSIGNFLTVLANPNVGEALLNTLIACGGGTAIAVAIGLFFSWIVVRTNTPFKGFIAAASILPLFAPPLVAGVAWAILGSPKTGLINTLFKWMGSDFRVDFYSMWGLVFVFGIYYAPYVYMFTSSALRNMDPSLEEAAEISGASAFATLFTVTFPLIMPAIVSGMLLSFIVMLGIYGIPAVLGAPTNLSVLTTYIFKLTNWSPPLYNTAAAVAIILMVVTGLLVYLQQKVLSGRSYTTVAGKAFRPRSLDLGHWRWLTFGIGIVYLLVVVVLPSLALIVAAFRKFMFIRDVASLFDMRQYSLVHFESIFDNPLTIRSIYNAVEVGVVTAVVGGALAFAIGYTIHRTQVKGRRAIDLISTLPVAIPGLVVGVAYLWAWIGVPGGLYGTVWILALAFIARFMPDTVKALSTSFLQIHRELEEAAWVCGKGMLGTIRTIVLPLARPGVLASMTLLFVLAIRELGSSLFLYTSNTMVMSVLLLDYYEGGNLGKTAAFSLVQTVLLGVLIGGANWLSRGSAQGSVARTG